MKTLKLFNAVIAKDSDTKPVVSDLGIVIEPSAVWAKKIILEYYSREKLDGNDLNQTFHKSWAKIRNSTRYELFVEQIRHYISTYGSKFESEIYIPNEVLDVKELKLKFIVIKSYTKEELTQKCLDLLKSGIALKSETVDDILSVLVDELDYCFTGQEGIRNKEAIVKIAETYRVYPENPVEFFRFVIFRTTNTTLLIKNQLLIELIKQSDYNPALLFKNYGLEKLAQIFNRFKPLFLAYKSKAPKTINKISKLSKKFHKPLIINPLNDVTNTILTTGDTHWLENATPFALFKALSACYSRMNGQNIFLYRIRNGKSWVQENSVSDVSKRNFEYILSYLKRKYDFTGKKVFIPKEVKYGLPTSEKMFVGNIPTGTRFYGDKLAVGIYWEDSWGANDLDLSGLNIAGKIGWNADYNQMHGNLMYSGDITSAPEGAVEYLYAAKGLNVPTLVKNNVYSGSSDAGYKVVIGKGDKVSRDYMMNPNNLLTEIKSNSVQKQTILGMLLPKKNRQCFVLLNFGAGHTRVSGNSEISNLAIKALYQQWNKPLSLNKILKKLGADLTDTVDDADINLSLDNLEKDTFIRLFDKLHVE
jgi:hypothetical protein